MGGWRFGGTVGLDCHVLSENESQAPIAEDKGAFLGAGFWVNFLPHDTWPIGLHSGHVLPVMAGPARRPAGGERAPWAGLGQVAQRWCRGPGVAPVGECAGPGRSKPGAAVFACLN